MGVGGPCHIITDSMSSFSYKMPLIHIILLPLQSQLCQPYSITSTTTAAPQAAAEMGSAAYDYTGCEQEYQPHFLDCCSLCSRPLSHNSDIFMYRGNTPFCSQDCRQEQIDMDEAMEKRWKLSSNSSSKRSNSVRKTSDSKKESRTVAVA